MRARGTPAPIVLKLLPARTGTPQPDTFVHMRSRHAVILSIALPLSMQATVWQVGPGQAYTLPSQVSVLVADGDTVDMAAGVYASDVARWQADDLLLRGVGGFAHLESNGQSWGGKAIWVIQGNNNVVEWIAFSECAVPDQNGAGIRLEGLGLTVRHCWFHHNENGILGGEYHPSTVRIEHCEFGYNGHGDGYSHNLYIGNIDTLVFRYNYAHHAHIGHELKSRARVNVIEYNRIGNEADGDASREIDLPNGGQAYLIGNVVQQGPQGENSNLVGFGMEGLSNPGPQQLYAINNTLVNEKATGSFFQLPATAYFKVWNNILAGGGSFVTAWPTEMDTLGNLRATAIGTVGFAAASAYDYRIGEASPAHNLGVPAGLATSGYPLVALFEYVHPTAGTERCQHATLDAGAFETCTTTGLLEQDDRSLLLYPNPASDVVTLAVPADASAVVLLDPVGNLVRAFSAQGGPIVQVDISSVASGSYFLCVHGPGRMQTQRFVKE